MSQYTTVHFIPRDSRWVPSQRVLRGLLTQLRAEVVSIAAYDAPLHWDADDLPQQTFRMDRIRMESAMNRLAVESAMLISIMVESRPWSDLLAKSLEAAIPSSIARGYVAWDVHMWIGPRTIPDPLGERTAAETMFDLTISGNGMPADLEEYLRLMVQTPEIAALSAELADITHEPWRTLITASY